MKKLASTIIIGFIFMLAMHTTALGAIEDVVTNDNENIHNLSDEEITLYILEDWAKEFISIPSDYLTSYQIDAGNEDNVQYYVSSGSSVKVDSTGKITPVYNWGASTVSIITDDSIIQLKVNVCDYADVYVEQVIDDYIAENISENQTVYEQMKIICQFPAGYNYSPYYSSAAGMILSGGGDCWASTQAILQMCEKLGYEAVSRNGSKDSGAGSGHRNVLVTIDENDYYVLDAGYSGSAPRMYDVIHKTTPFSYRRTTDGIEIYQYDADMSQMTTLIIPDYIDDIPVTSIGDEFINRENSLKEIVIPDTITSIGYGAFNSCEGLEKVHIPASVNHIDSFVFSNCYSLTELTCSEENPYFTAIDGILYDKNCTSVLYGPGCSVAALPDSVESISDYAFYCNRNLTRVTMPDSVKTIGEGAFGECRSLASITMESVEVIDSFAFFICPNLTYMVLPETVESIGAYAIGFDANRNIYDDFILVGIIGSASNIYAEENGITFVDAAVSQWVDLESGQKYFVEGHPVTGWYKIGNECRFFDENGYVTTEQSTVIKNAVAATCTENGYTGDTICTICGDIVEVGKVSQAVGHTWGEWTVLIQPTVTDVGLEQRLCVCGEVQERSIDKLPVIEPEPTPEPTPEPGPSAQFKNPFVDVERDAWYYDAVMWGSESKVVAGLTETVFGTNVECTRAQIVTLIWRAEGKPMANKRNHSFTDIAEDQYYYEAVLWAVEEGIVAGRTETMFAPDATCTRAEMATFLWRHAGKDVVDAENGQFVDIEESQWYYKAANWAAANKVISGYIGGVFAPNDTVTRAQTVTMLYRYYQ